MIKQNNIEGIILGCTEIEMLIKPNDIDIPIFDTIVDYSLERKGVDNPTTTQD